MTSKKESIVSILNSYENFQPSSPEDDSTEFGKLLEEYQTVSNDRNSVLESYNTGTDARVNLINRDKFSLKKSILPIRLYLQKILEKDDEQNIYLQELLNNLRDFKPFKEPKVFDKKSIDDSSQVYTSLTQKFLELINALKELKPAYNPEDENVKIGQLENKLENLEKVNENITKSQYLYIEKQQQFSDLEDDLKNRLKRIKETVRSQYGHSSQEYKKIKAYRI